MNDRQLELSNCMGDDYDELIFWSFRYFLGRRTIASFCFMQDILKNFDLLSDKNKELIGSEIQKFLYDVSKSDEIFPNTSLHILNLIVDKSKEFLKHNIDESNLCDKCGFIVYSSCKCSLMK